MNRIKQIFKTVLITTLILLVVFLSVKSMKYYQKARKQPETVYLTKTLTNIVYDTVYLERYKTVKLPVVDSTVYYITDTVARVDSVFVEVPISVYKLDTTFFTDTTCLNIRIQNSGYAVTLDTLSYRLEYTPTPKKSNFFREHFKFGAGVSTGFGVFSKKPDVFLSIGFYYCF